MTVQELCELGRKIELAKEAREAAKLVQDSFYMLFTPENLILPVYTVEVKEEELSPYCGEATLTSDGIWTYSDNWGGKYEIEITEDRIFEYMCKTEDSAGNDEVLAIDRS